MAGRPDRAQDGPERSAGHDTIAAVATPPGRGAVGVVRVSGPGSRAVLAALGADSLEPRRATLRRLRHPETGEALDRALVTWFPGPGSYTGEDAAEIHCHGGAVVPQRVLDGTLAGGARPARPGEFTRRAFLNGKMDLLQAEATADLVEARSPAMGSAALRQLEGGLSRRVEELRKRVLELQALIVYEIDFPEEDGAPPEEARIEAARAALLEALDGLLRLAPEGELLRDGALVVVAGRPNVGKSSIFNCLVGFERAIVTEEPGTTRDAVEALVGVDGYPFRLVDTAGLRETAERVEGLGIEVARGYLARADLVLFCAEAGRSLGSDEEAFLGARAGDAGPTILVRTKADLAAPGPAGQDEVAVSARTGEGIAELRRRMLQTAFGGLRAAAEEPFVTRARHARALRAARAEVEAFGAARRGGMPPEIVDTHLQEAVERLEEVLGVTDSEEILEAVFRTFCVGK